MRLAAHGITVDLPEGWEGQITAARDAEAGKGGATAPPVVHLSTAPLAPGRGDFGSGLVEHLGRDDAFVALVEYGPDCAGTPMFARAGLPRRLRSRAFNRRALQRSLGGQCGQQVFFTHGARAFCLYVVLGRDHDLEPLLDRVHRLLAGIAIA